MQPDETKPRVSVVVTVRDRVRASEDTIEALCATIPKDAELIYVSGNLRGRRSDWLDQQAARYGFKRVESGRHMTPAEAKNFGAGRASGDYIVFIENDVIPRQGWLEALVSCADETRGAVVAPVTCEGRPLHTIVHHVGEPLVNHDEFVETPEGPRDFKETLPFQGENVNDLDLKRRRTQTSEAHCFLVRRDMLEKLGGLDSSIVSKDFFDFSWHVRRAGGEIWLEPEAVVTFLVPSEEDPVYLSDLPYFLLRWSPAWQRVSHDKLKEKWGFQEAGYIAERRALADWRIMDHVVKPALRKVPVLGKRWGFVERCSKIVYPPLERFGNHMARRHHLARDRAGATGGADVH